VIFLDAAVAKAGAEAAQWNTVSLAANIPTWSRCAAFYSPVGGGVRKIGTTIAVATRSNWWLVETDSSQQVELWGNANYYLLGYGHDVYKSQSPVDITPADTTGWQNVTLDVPVGTTGALIQATMPTLGWLVGAQYPTVDDDLYGTLSGTDVCNMFSGVDGSLQVALYKAAAVSYVLIGYISSLGFTANPNPSANDIIAIPQSAWTDDVDNQTSRGSPYAIKQTNMAVAGARIKGEAVALTDGAVGSISHVIAGNQTPAVTTVQLYAESATTRTGFRLGWFYMHYTTTLTETVTPTDVVTNTQTSGAAGRLYPQGRVGKLYLVEGSLER